MAETGVPSLPSRYKSQRRPQHSLDDTSSPDLPLSEPIDEAVARSKSRYRRKPDVAVESPPPLEPQLPDAQQQQQAAVPSRYHSKSRRSPTQPMYQEHIVQAPVHRQRTNTTNRRPDPRGYRNYASDEATSGAEDADAPQRVDSRYHGTQRKTDFGPTTSPPVSPPAAPVTAAELFPPPRPVTPPPPRQDGPPQSGNIRATKSTPDLNLSDYADETGCFGGLFRRKRIDPMPVAAGSPQAARPKTAKGEPPTSKQGPAAGPDAPISAINAGDRHVLVECQKSRTLFPVTPTTTPLDLIKSAATCMSERIEIKSAVLLEQFNSVGVQRPLRRYEHIRDVMNSWDTDRQNSLVLIDPGTGTVEPELTLAGVPRVEPEEQTWSLLYSQKAGKWDKRFVTLRANGQLVCQKDIEKPKDLTVVCHLSDFDIYMPTPDRMKKKIKPPKKYCFAIKSQQKTSLFESTHDFVHFFSCGDRAEADRFYAGIQSWRSWYLVNIKGEGQKEKERAKPAAAPAVAPAAAPVVKDRSSSNDHAKTHRPKFSTDSHYQLGSFRPFSIDMNQFERRPSSSKSDNAPCNGFAKSSNQFDANVSPERRTSSAKRHHPPTSLKSKPQLAEDEPLANLNRSNSAAKRRPSSEKSRPEASEFKTSGLLGRQYSQRRKEYEEREQKQSQPFTNAPNLLNGGMGDREYFGSGEGVQRSGSVRRSGNPSGELKRSGSVRDGSRNGGHARGSSIDLDRSGTRRNKPKPLIDLTPQYQEPPQHSKKGRGFHPEQVDQNGLITNATSPEDPLGIPQQTVFRNTSGQHIGPSSPGLLDLTPQHREPTHHAMKGRGHYVDNAAANGGLIGSATSPEDPLGLPQNTFRSRGKSLSEHQQQRQVSASRPSQPDEAFTGQGLLGAAANRQGWGGNDKGRGVINGSRANGKPLVDLAADSRFAQGSLLQHVERTEGGPVPPPVIDREKRYEREERVGEGY